MVGGNFSTIRGQVCTCKHKLMYEYLNNGQVDDTKKNTKPNRQICNTKSKLMNICQIIQKEN